MTQRSASSIGGGGRRCGGGGGGGGGGGCVAGANNGRSLVSDNDTIGGPCGGCCSNCGPLKRFAGLAFIGAISPCIRSTNCCDVGSAGGGGDGGQGGRAARFR